MSIGWSVPKKWVNKKDYNDIIREVSEDKNAAKYINKRIEARRSSNMMAYHVSGNTNLSASSFSKNMGRFYKERSNRLKSVSTDDIQSSRFNSVKRIIIKNKV
jgi:hypothetical protein